MPFAIRIVVVDSMSTHFLDTQSNCLFISNSLAWSLFHFSLYHTICVWYSIDSMRNIWFFVYKKKKKQSRIKTQSTASFDCNETCLFLFCNSINPAHSENRFIVPVFIVVPFLSLCNTKILSKSFESNKTSRINRITFIIFCCSCLNAYKCQLFCGQAFFFYDIEPIGSNKTI